MKATTWPPALWDWTRAAPGSFKVLEPGGKLSYALPLRQLRRQRRRLRLQKAGFKDVQNISDVLVTATKP